MIIFVGGALRNPLNGSLSRAHWSHKSRWAKEWKHRTRVALLEARPWPPALLEPADPKRITFTAHVAGKWDDDSIPAAIKPARDALIGNVIHSDAPDSGHEFIYAPAVIDRKHRGIQIAITAKEP